MRIQTLVPVALLLAPMAFRAMGEAAQAQDTVQETTVSGTNKNAVHTQIRTPAVAVPSQPLPLQLAHVQPGDIPAHPPDEPYRLVDLAGPDGNRRGATAGIIGWEAT